MERTLRRAILACFLTLILGAVGAWAAAGDGPSQSPARPEATGQPTQPPAAAHQDAEPAGELPLFQDGNGCSAGEAALPFEPSPPRTPASCVPPNGCSISCKVRSDCDAICCGPNFGLCPSSGDCKGRCICLA